MDSIEKIRDKYRKFIKERDWERFQSPKNISMALAVEAGELMEVFMWLSEKQVEVLPTKYPELYQNAKDEIADVFLYLIRIADQLNIDLIKAAEEKFLKNEQKYTVEKGRALARSLE